MTNQITKIGAVPTLLFGDAAYNTSGGVSLGAVIGGPSRTQLDVHDAGRYGSGILAGENLQPWDACFVYQGRAYRCEADDTGHTYTGPTLSVSGTQAATFDGFADAMTQAGEPVTLYRGGVEANYVSATSLTAIGNGHVELYISASVKGGLQDTAPTVNSVVQAAVAISLGDGRIRSK